MIRFSPAGKPAGRELLSLRDTWIAHVGQEWPTYGLGVGFLRRVSSLVGSCCPFGTCRLRMSAKSGQTTVCELVFSGGRVH